MEQTLYTVADLSDMLKIGRTRLYALVSSGSLPVVRIGRSVRVRADDLDRWLKERGEVANELTNARQSCAPLT